MGTLAGLVIGVVMPIVTLRLEPDIAPNRNPVSPPPVSAEPPAELPTEIPAIEPDVAGNWVVEGQECRFAFSLSRRADVLTFVGSDGIITTEVISATVSPSDVTTRSGRYFRRGGSLVLENGGQEQVFAPCP